MRTALIGIAAAIGALGMGGCPGSVPQDAPRVAVQRIAEGITAPVALALPDDGSRRIFIVSQSGLITILEDGGTLRETPFLDVRDRMVGPLRVFDERGLLGLAFHPQYADNGRFFVFYNAPPGPNTPEGFNTQSHVSEFRVSSDDANRADPDSERILLVIPKPQSNHNGGQLAFGPDGYLYISTGDGGGAGDAGFGHTARLGNAQDKSKLLGKILRIDVDGGHPYEIPPDNPFVNDPQARPEVYALGFRNPWRFSFDVAPGGPTRLFVGDVGQARIEEVDIVQRGGNYGWRIREGRSCFSPTSPFAAPGDCPSTAADGAPLIEPILQYSHSEGTAVIGGFFYRGDAVEALRGRYVFADFSLSGSGRIFAATEDNDGSWSFEELAVINGVGNRIGRFVYGSGLDPDGEILILTNTPRTPSGSGGEVWRIVPP